MKVVHNKTKVKTKEKDGARPMKRSGIGIIITTAHDGTKYEIQDNGSWKRIST